jgi:hypothetical protein
MINGVLHGVSDTREVLYVPPEKTATRSAGHRGRWVASMIPMGLQKPYLLCDLAHAGYPSADEHLCLERVVPELRCRKQVHT